MTSEVAGKLRNKIEDVLHITWAFSSKRLSGFEPEKIAVLDVIDRGYHTSYKDFIENIVQLIAAERQEAAREARIDELKRLPWNYQNHAFSWHDIQDRLAQLNAELVEENAQS